MLQHLNDHQDDLSSITVPGMRVGNPCRAIRVSEALSAAESDEISALVQGSRTPELSTLRYPGRTIYTDKFRIKGAFGLEVGPYGSVNLKERDPMTEYGQSLPHMKLTADMRLTVVQSRPRALFCLSRQGALTEYECMLRMSERGRALPPCFAGEYLLANGEAEFMLPGIFKTEGEPTGVFVQRHDRDLQFLGAVLGTHLLGDDLFGRGIEQIAVGHPDFNLLPPGALLERIERYVEFSGKIGEVRRVAIEQGILRHVAHLGNFLVSRNDELYMLDSDSCLVVGWNFFPEKGEAGAQLVRDLCNDMVRLSTYLLRDSFSREFLEIIDNGFNAGLDPSHQFLRSVCKGLVGEDRLHELSRFFFDLSIGHVRSISMILKSISQTRATSFLNEDLKQQSKMENIFAFALEPLRKYALYVAHSLVHEMRIPGYEIESEPTSESIAEYQAGVDRYIESLRDCYFNG